LQLNRSTTAIIAYNDHSSATALLLLCSAVPPHFHYLEVLLHPRWPTALCVCYAVVELYLPAAAAPVAAALTD